MLPVATKSDDGRRFGTRAMNETEGKNKSQANGLVLIFSDQDPSTVAN
jgi:hypothetical protein